MEIAVCDDQAEVLNTVERMFLEVGGITGIENGDIYQDIRKKNFRREIARMY